MKFKYLILLPLLLTACEKADKSKTIFTSFDLIKNLASNIIGNRFEIENIVPSGTEPHDFELTAEKLVYLTECKASFINGLNFESWTTNLPSEVTKKMYDTTKEVTPMYIDGKLDPHAWLDPTNAIKQMELIANTMSEIDQPNRTYYEANLLNYKNQFIELDNECKQIADTFVNKNIVVSHAAYGYMCARYGLNQIYINGIEADEEPTTKTITEIIDKVKQLHITTIFTEELISPIIAEKIASETGVKIEMLNTMETIDEGESYISLMKDNFRKLEKACK